MDVTQFAIFTGLLPHSRHRHLRRTGVLRGADGGEGCRFLIDPYYVFEELVLISKKKLELFIHTVSQQMKSDKSDIKSIRHQ